ncbi:hypothetical protein WCT98_20700, partial [Pectobacterium brasiliense]
RHGACGIVKLAGEQGAVQLLPYHPVTEVILQLDMAGRGGDLGQPACGVIAVMQGIVPLKATIIRLPSTWPSCA